MKFENSGIQNTTADLNHLDYLLAKYGLIVKSIGITKELV